MTRLDRRLVDEGFAPSRTRARALLEAGVVRVAGQIVTKPSGLVDGPIELMADPCPWVSRAGLKLDHALTEFDLTPAGVALDIGASTGGFTQVLLARGADHVFAVDVGHGQLAAPLAADPRVTNLERVNARELPDGLIRRLTGSRQMSPSSRWKRFWPAPMALAKPGAVLVALVKPQFEAGPARVGRRHRPRCMRSRRRPRPVRSFVAAQGWTVLGEIQARLKALTAIANFSSPRAPQMRDRRSAGQRPLLSAGV